MTYFFLYTFTQYPLVLSWRGRENENKIVYPCWFFRGIWCCVEIVMVLVKFILNILFVKEPTLECVFWLIIEGYIVSLLDYLSLFISGCCLLTIYPNTTYPLISIHVIILIYLDSNAKDTWFVDMYLKQCELWYEL